MPFRLRVSEIDHNPSEIAITGKIVAGAFFGPEAVSVCDQDGCWHEGIVTHHELLLPEGWPVLPQHATTLVLHVATRHPGLRVDHSQPVIGRGTLSANHACTDITDALYGSELWAIQLGLHLGEIEDAYEMGWGLSNEDVNTAYRALIEDHLKAGVWPYLRFSVGGAQYIEIEYAAVAEYQTRFWIGDLVARQRILLGYDSGHFSLPAFRLEEVLMLAAKIKPHPAAALFLLTATYFEVDASKPTDEVRGWIEAIPGIRTGNIALLAEELLDRTASDLHWQLDNTLGWINDGKYSQRNPKSAMSLLTAHDYRFIRMFFAGL